MTNTFYSIAELILLFFLKLIFYVGRIELFDNALKEGYITSKWTKLCVLGPPGSGKSALLQLLVPNKLHHSPTAKSISDSSVQTTLDNDKQEHRIQQHVIIAKVEGKKHVWYLADINSIKLKVAEAIKKHSDFEDSSVEGHSKEVKGCSIYDEILEMLPYVEKSSELDETHFIYAFNSGSQAGVLDLATALLRSRSVNIVAIELNEKLASRDEFFYTTDEEEMVGIGASNLQLLKDAFRCQASIPLPNLPDVKEFKPSGSERRFFVVATYSGRIQDSITLGETLDEKNKCLQKDLENYEEVIIPYNSEKNEMIFPINATSVGEEEVRIAELIRSNAALVYIQGKVPIRWFLFQLELYKLKSKVVTIAQCHQIGKSLKMTEEDVKAALLYFHDLTICFYFPSVLENVVFIHPQILFDKLSQIIAIASGSLSPPTLTMRTHTNLKQKAILQSALFEIISDSFEDGVFTAEDFLKLMTHLLVIAKLNDKNQYFIPCVLPTTDSPDKSFFGEVEPLIFTWDSEPIPQGLFVVLIGYLLNRSPHPFEVVGKVSQFCNAIQLVFKQLGVTILLVDAIHWLELYSSDRSECFAIREIVLESVIAVIEEFKIALTVSPNEKFLCTSDDCLSSNSHPHLCEFTKNRSQLQCDQYKKMNCKDNPRYLSWYQKECKNNNNYIKCNFICRLHISLV